MRYIRRIKEVPVFSNSFGTLYNDDVEGLNNTRGKYLRWQWSEDGVIIVPVANNKFALGRMFRYPPYREFLEFPGGGIKPGETIIDAAKRELGEELGLFANSIEIVGKIYPDTGILSKAINVAIAYLSEENKLENTNNSIEPMEYIDKDVVWVDNNEFLKKIQFGEIVSGTTLSSFVLFQSIILNDQ